MEEDGGDNMQWCFSAADGLIISEKTISKTSASRVNEVDRLCQGLI